MQMERYIGIDFGGTNLRIAEVDPETGKIVDEPFSTNISEVYTNKELTDIIRGRIPENANIGISAAGEVDEKNLVVRLSPNSKIEEEVIFGRDLKESGYDVTMTNDMKAAAQAVSKYGNGMHFDNVLVATYSSGYNCAVVRDGKNTTTAEFGHLVYKPDGDLFCGCGGKGHLEAYVSGNGAAAMAKNYFNITHRKDSEILRFAYDDEFGEIKLNDVLYEISRDPELFRNVVNSIKAEHVYKAYNAKPEKEPQKSIKKTQVEAIAVSFGMMASSYNPVDIMVLMGSQTKDWGVLFDPAIEKYNNNTLQLTSLKKPKITITNLPEIGVQGAVAYLLNNK
ncbi:ROK family protein [Candidatus Woesearchaeota archaeon]|nr:ROK family protein [Candidatus Woesearchaeota archaeon]